MSETIEPASKENTTSFDHFLENWIDSNQLDRYMGWLQSSHSIVSTVTLLSGMKPIPNLKTLENIMITHTGRSYMLSSRNISEEDKTKYCQFKDHLLEYILYVFGHYNHTFEEGGVNIFEKYCRRPKKGIRNPKAIEDDEFESIPQDFKLTAVRIRKIYKIITKYIIGFDDLSDHSVREALKLKSITRNTKHRLIFILGEIAEQRPSWFGTPDESGSTLEQLEPEEYRGGKHTKRKRIRKSITQKKRASRLSSSL